MAIIIRRGKGAQPTLVDNKKKSIYKSSLKFNGENKENYS